MIIDIKAKKLHPEAVIPKYANPGDAGLDLTAISREADYENKQITYSTGLAITIPEGYVGLLFPRSSVYKYGLSLCNSVGVIDSGYRGEIKLKFNMLNSDKIYKKGDRVGQLIILPQPHVNITEVESLDISYRGGQGFGSTGR